MRQLLLSKKNFVGVNDPTTTATWTLKYQFKLEKQQDSFESKIYTVLSCISIDLFLLSTFSVYFLQ